MAKSRTKDLKRHLSRLVSLGCIVCGDGAEVHHIRSLAAGAGMGLKTSDLDAIPLCPSHHRTGGPGTAFHAGPAIWEEIFGRQIDLLAQVRAELGI